MAYGGLCRWHGTSGSNLPFSPRVLSDHTWRQTSSRIEEDRVHGLAAATRTTYDRFWRLWRECWGGCEPSAPGVQDLARFIDWLAYTKLWRSASIGSALGGIATCYTLRGISIPSADKLLKLQLKGLARKEPAASKSQTIVPSMWLHLWFTILWAQQS